MAAVVKVQGGVLTLADPSAADGGVTAYTSGNRMVFICGLHTTFPTISGITDTLGSTWSQVDTFTIGTDAYWEVWTALVPSTGLNDLTVDFSAAPAGGNGFWLIELSDCDFIESGESDTGSYSATQSAVMPTLTTSRAGLVITTAHNTSNFADTWTINDSFTKIQSTSGRYLTAYRLTSGGVSAAPTIDFSAGGINEAGQSLTFVLYTEGEQIKGSFVFGVDGKVTSTHTILDNLDGVDRTGASAVSAEGSHVIGGNLMLIEQASAPTGIANSVRLFTEDNGSGKTRLMAQFGSGAAVQIAIEP